VRARDFTLRFAQFAVGAAQLFAGSLNFLLLGGALLTHLFCLGPRGLGAFAFAFRLCAGRFPGPLGYELCLAAHAFGFHSGPLGFLQNLLVFGLYKRLFFGLGGLLAGVCGA
jgi:hypothetical protein